MDHKVKDYKHIGPWNIKKYYLQIGYESIMESGDCYQHNQVKKDWQRKK